ncbi:MAG: hypothetical protein KGH57_00130 [Candidatus Micrarchaeota archaeon]|nr:hypothetical protein [Candidatus Micrarchaeota archaeon]
MAKAQQNMTAFILELIGSLAFLYVVFGGGLAGSPSGTFAGAGAFFTPLFLGAAVIASVALFFASFGNLSGMAGPRLSLMGMGDSALAALTLTAFTWSWSGGQSVYLWATLIGFILSFLGAAYGGKK